MAKTKNDTTASASNAPIFVYEVKVDDAASKNYIKGRPFTDPPPNPAPILIGRDSKMYISKPLVPAGTKGFRITVEAIL